MTSFSYLLHPKITVNVSSHCSESVWGNFRKTFASEVKPVKKPPFDCSWKLRALTGSVRGQ